MFFKDIIGQEDIKNHLIRSVKEGRVAHAQMFYGNSGVGCLPMALAYAQYICCQNPLENDSCGECSSCKKHAKLIHPDLHFVFPIINKKSGDEGSVCDDFLSLFREALLRSPYLSLQDWQGVLNDSKKPIIYTREGDEIIHKLNLKPFEASYKIIIIWCAEQMHESCANKLLKVLEEPQGQTLFILVSDNIENILSTIKSRVQQIFFPPIAYKFLMLELEKNGLSDDENAGFYIKNSMGNLNLLYKNIANNEMRQKYFSMFVDMMRGAWILNENIFEQQWKQLIKQFADLGRASQISFFQEVQRELRENFIFNLNKPCLVYMNKEEHLFAEKFSRFVNERNIEQFMDEFALAEVHIDQNVKAEYVFLDLMLKINELLKQ